MYVKPMALVDGYKLMSGVRWLENASLVEVVVMILVDAYVEDGEE